ncbi:response regulator transcription factor [Cohnella hashimotonis]|uniref:Response regulator n=1 Tax=Cohnella hashimotonis TaxID=2826895 RepID=A0ABT6TGE2_9BACL|nr:response regulator [Cohnella hashimotonis]MDI4645646.1 response regulator [Cohnella hashimotonis]
MYKVMIVEDEMLVRVGLRSSVDWSKYGMEVAADLPDGQAAWDYYEKEKPDIVITDIRMPRMDGMQLIERIREADKTTRIVVLSCLEEFDLARRAMSLGVSHYILKLTMTEAEIGGVLEGVRRSLDEQSARGQPGEGKPHPSNLDLVKEKMLKDFLFYNIFSADEFERFVVQHSLRLQPVRLVACKMELDRFARIQEKFKDEHGHLIKMTLLNVLGEIASAACRGEAFCIDDKHYVILLSFEDVASEQSIQQETHAILSRIQEAISTYFGASASFGVSGIRSGYKNLPALYADAGKALRHKFLTGTGQMHRVGQLPDLAGVRARIARLRDAAPLRALLSPIKLKEYEAYLTSLEASLTDDRKTIESLLFHFLQWVGTSLYNDGQNEKTLLMNVTGQLEEADTLLEMLDCVSVFFAEIVEETRNRLHMSSDITKAIQYIKQHYKENISLQAVADHVNLSFSYLSFLFKKELQITFIDYLNRYRIERAKELMASTQMKSYDIAVEVGFSPEYTYFSKVFKKVTGLNPNDYRRQRTSGQAAAE